MLDSTASIGAATSSYTNPLLSIQETEPYADTMETYLAEINFSDILPPLTYWHGAENFTEARATVVTRNDGSAVPGGYNDHENFAVIEYRSQYGWGTYGSAATIRAASYGDADQGSGTTSTWDLYCATK